MAAKKINILQVNKAYYPHIGGIETLVQTFSEELSKMANVRVLVCTEKGKAHHETINGVPVEYASSLGTYFSCPLSFDFIRKFRRMAKWADIIEIHCPFPLGDIAALLSGYHGPIVIAWHSDVVRQKTLLRFYAPLLRRFLRRADKIIVATQGHIKSSAFLPDYADKCTIIPYGIDTDAYANNPRRPILRDKQTNFATIRLLFVGRFVYYKGIEVLLDAFPKTHNTELFLVGVGTPEMEQSLHDKINKSGVNERVHFLGNLSQEDLRSAFADCDIFILPSIANSEAFGIVQLEAMTYGKPVINTNLPTGVPYVSVDGQTGITVPPNDPSALAVAINRLVDSPALCAEYGVAAAKRVATQFNQKNMISKTYDTFVDLIDNHPTTKK